jgi:superfamily II DNA or RNA helicase
MKTEHVFKYKLLNNGRSNACELIPVDFTFETFRQNLNKLSTRVKNPQDFMEKGFQSFVEAVIVHFSNKIGIANYHTTNSVTHRYKAHGTGIRNGNIVTTFFAFNGDEFVTDKNSQITEYFAQSNYIDGFSMNINEKVFNVFTDAKDLHENTKKNFVDINKTEIYGIEEIKQLVDGDEFFWKSYKNSLECVQIESVNAVFEPDEYQLAAIEDLLSEKSGKYQVVWPTGTGKNEIMMEYSIRLIKKSLANNPKILFVSPRITLGKQGIRKILNRLGQYGIDNCTIVNFSSGDYDNDSSAKDIAKSNMEDVINTTNIIELNKAISNATGPVLVFSTYHSVYKIIDEGMKFELINCDEAHNIVKGRSIPLQSRELLISNDILQLTPIMVFYTATQALDGTPDTPVVDGKGMDNPELFGTIISKRTPKEMIEYGRIVKPMIYHFTITKAMLRKHNIFNTATQEEITKNAELNAYIIWESFQDAERTNDEKSVDSSQNAIKMLVRCMGGQSYSDTIKSRTFKNYQKERPDVAIYAISSNWKIYRNGKECNSDAYNINMFMNELLIKNSDEKAIILHIAMVGEGWDVPGINAILPFGDMGDITSSQTLGRGMRLHSYDRERLLSGEIVPEDCYRGKFFKPFCYVVMPKYSGFTDINRNGVERMVDLIQSEIGYCPFEIFNEERYDGKMNTVPAPRIDKTYVAPEEIEHEFSIILSIQERKRQEAFNREVELQKNEILEAVRNL